MADLYLWRQIFILLPSILICISGGIMLAFPSVLLPTILSQNITDIEVTKDQASWITTSNGMAGILGFIVLPAIMQTFGRRAVQIIITLFLAIGWIIFALAHSVTALMSARIIQGLDMGGVYAHAILLSEYAAPSRRGYFMAATKVGVPVGVLLCHSLSFIWNWRQIATFALVPTLLACGLTLFWPESPFHLAMKGRYKESEKSFIWLHGGSNMQELHLLHSSQLQKKSTKKWYNTVFKKDFIKPFVIVSLLTIIMEFSGKHYFAVYAIQMMIELVGDKSIAIYVSIGADLLTITACVFAFFIVRCFKSRTILFLFGIITVALMFLICIVVIFKSYIVMWLAPTLIVLHNFIINSSVVPICFTMFGEMFPLEYKGLGTTSTGFVFVATYTMMLKLTPVLIESTGVGGAYAMYGITILGCLAVLYGILPETKNRTLLEIENELKGVDFSNRDVMLPTNIIPEST